MIWDSMVLVGRIVRPHGHRGAVVVEPESDFAHDRFTEGAVLFRQQNAGAVPVTVTASREFRGRWIVSLEGVDTMTQAETLRGLELRIPAEAVHALAPGSFYVHDLVGCEVRTAEGDLLGRVERVEFGSGTPVLMVEDAAGGEVLVPLAEEICREIDPAAKRIVIDPPEGLVELNRPARR